MKKLAIIILTLGFGFSIQAQTTKNPENKQQVVIVKSDSSAIKPATPVKKFDTSKIQHKSVLATKEQKYVVPTATKITPSQAKTPPAVTKEEE